MEEERGLVPAIQQRSVGSLLSALPPPRPSQYPTATPGSGAPSPPWPPACCPRAGSRLPGAAVSPAGALTCRAWTARDAEPGRSPRGVGAGRGAGAR